MAAFSLMCLAAVGLALACPGASRLATPAPPAVRHDAFVTVGPALRIRLAEAVVPADAWRRIVAQCGGDQARIAAALSKDGYVSWEQSVIASSDNTPVVCRWRSRVGEPVRSGGAAPPGRLATEDRTYSVRPRLNADGTITIRVASERGVPAGSQGERGTDRFGRWEKDVTLPDGSTRIVCAVQPAPAAPARICFVTAGNAGVWRTLPYPAGHRERAVFPANA